MLTTNLTHALLAIPFPITQDKNIPAFLDYCTMVFKHFGPRIRLWATFNEPTVGGWAGGLLPAVRLARAASWISGLGLGLVWKGRCSARLARLLLPPRISRVAHNTPAPYTPTPHVQCFSFVGYIVGLWCPGERLKMTKCGVVLCNLMKVGHIPNGLSNLGALGRAVHPLNTDFIPPLPGTCVITSTNDTST